MNQSLSNLFQELNIKEYFEQELDKREIIEHFNLAILASILISSLQAFEDGNKRSSRVVANALLLAHDFCPVSYRNLNETEYKKAMVLFYEQNNLSYFKKLFLEQFEFAVNNYWS